MRAQPAKAHFGQLWHFQRGSRHVALDRVAVSAPALVIKQGLELVSVGLTVLVRQQIALFHQALGHGFGGQPAGLAHHGRTKHTRFELFLWVNAPELFNRGPIQAAQLRNGREQVVFLGVDALGVAHRGRAIYPVAILGRKERPGPVDRLAHHLFGDLLLGGLTLARRLFLQVLEGLALGVGQPLHIAQAAALQLVGGVRRSFFAQALIVREFLGRHARVTGRLEQGPVSTNLFGGLDSLVAGQHAVKHAAHLGRELHMQGRERLVDVQQPRPECLECTGQAHAGGFAFHHVGLKAPGKVLVKMTLFVQR